MIQGPLALSLGDPAGIGPEITVKAWLALRHEGPSFLVVGDAATLARFGAPVEALSDPSKAHDVFEHALPVLDIPLADPVTFGAPSPQSAPRVIEWIEAATRLVQAGTARALVTAPIAKATLYGAGFGFPGHTEFLGKLAPTPAGEPGRGPVMMLVAGGLRASLVTIHEPLARVPTLLTKEAIVNVGLVTARALTRDFGLTAPRLAIAGLNPHAGESGTLGREEIEIIAPAVQALVERGVDASGPHPADSLFHPDARARYDGVVCLYHDQALIPVKTVDFWGGVNVSLGLGIVRTSPDHGVGFDIAGSGVARADSLIAALRLAADIAARRNG